MSTEKIIKLITYIDYVLLASLIIIAIVIL